MIEDYIPLVLRDLMPEADWGSDEMKRTPERWAKMMVELTDRSSCEFEFTTFESAVDEMVVVRNIPFVTLCSHHLIPFIGKCHIGYVPNGKIAGLSKLPRLVKWAAKGTWNQEALTTYISAKMTEYLDPLGVAVIMEAEHLCMSIRGIESRESSTVTSKMTGCFADHNRTAKAEFMQQIGGI